MSIRDYVTLRVGGQLFGVDAEELPTHTQGYVVADAHATALSSFEDCGRRWCSARPRS